MDEQTTVETTATAAETTAVKEQATPTAKTFTQDELNAIIDKRLERERKDAQARIEKGLVFVNNTPCMKPEHQITEGDRLTVRGVGRARVEAFGGTSRKGRIFLEYVRNA